MSGKVDVHAACGWCEEGWPTLSIGGRAYHSVPEPVSQIPCANSQPVNVLARIAAVWGECSQEYAAVAELIEAAKRAEVLVRLLTVRQVIEAGDEAIDAAGLNPYCINEGLAEGRERISFWRLNMALARCGASQ